MATGDVTSRLAEVEYRLMVLEALLAPQLTKKAQTEQKAAAEAQAAYEKAQEAQLAEEAKAAAEAATAGEEAADARVWAYLRGVLSTQVQGAGGPTAPAPNPPGG
jgi:membrane protein involved in colicin uptake